MTKVSVRSVASPTLLALEAKIPMRPAQPTPWGT